MPTWDMLRKILYYIKFENCCYLNCFFSHPLVYIMTATLMYIYINFQVICVYLECLHQRAVLQLKLKITQSQTGMFDI